MGNPINRTDPRGMDLFDDVVAEMNWQMYMWATGNYHYDGGQGYYDSMFEVGGGGYYGGGGGGGTSGLFGNGQSTWTCEDQRKSCREAANNYGIECVGAVTLGFAGCEAVCATACAPAALFFGYGYVACFGACSTRCAIVGAVGVNGCAVESVGMNQQCQSEYQDCVRRRSPR